MESLLGTSIWVFLGLTVIITGGAAAMMGQAIAITWRPFWQVVVYSILLGPADRFLVFALFEGTLLSLSGFVVHTLTVMMIASLAFRIARARNMVNQYPWLYKRSGLFGWQAIDGGD